jgi:cysteine desulfurase
LLRVRGGAIINGVRIYLDHNATTPVDPLVVDAMTEVLRQDFGNASSVHSFGQRAKLLLDRARASVAAMLDVDPAEIVFTSGGTEADNLALRGAAEALGPALPGKAGRRHLIVSAIEHEAVLQTGKALARRGWRVTHLAVDGSGRVDPAALEAVIGQDTAVVSVMHSNNEIGVVQPIPELAAIARAHGALFHTDAVQSVGKIPVSARALGVDLLAISAHKFNGPKGAGALWVRRGTRLAPHATGGRQEKNRRAGTENLPAIVGLGVAADQVMSKLTTEAPRIAGLRDRLERGVLARVPRATINGAAAPRVGNTANIGFEGIEAESLLIALDLEGVAVSTGSACSSGTLEPSHVLKAMGLPLHDTQNAIRFSLGSSTTEADVDQVVALLPGLVERLRQVTQGQATRSHLSLGAR